MPYNRRYVLPQTEAFLETLNTEFKAATGTSLLVDSAIRPASVQADLSRWNRNAAAASGVAASTHERGTTVDLSRRMRQADYEWLRLRLFWYQARGKILVIEEFQCLHVFVGEVPDGDNMLTQRESDCRQAIITVVTLMTDVHPTDVMRLKGFSYEEIQKQLSNMIYDGTLIFTSDQTLVLPSEDDKFWEEFKKYRPWLLGLRKDPPL